MHRLYFTLILLSSVILSVLPIQLNNSGEQIKENNLDSQLNECISVQRNTEVGVCFGKELLHKLNQYDESDSFSLANGVSFVRDEKTPRDFGHFLDNDPMDFRAMMEDASNLISKRSLHWDLSTLYPGLVMKIGPTLANGVLEFVMDPRIKDRTFQQHPPKQTLSTGRLLAKNLLVPFLLGFKFHISTLLPLLLGLLLLASKKVFLLAKVALLAVTLFSSGSGLGQGFGQGYGQGGYGGQFGGPALSDYTHESLSSNHHHHGPPGGYYNRHPHHAEYFYKEKSSDQSTGSPITPDELRDRLERLFVTKKDMDETSSESKVRNARNFAWTPINTG